MKKYITVIILFFLLVSSSFSQERHLVDSLLNVIKKNKSDTTKVLDLISLSKECFNINIDEGIGYAQESKVLAQKLKYSKGHALALKTIGIGYYKKGEYIDAFNNWELAIEVYKSMGDMSGVSNMLNNQGAIFFNQTETAKALELHLQSLKIAEDLKDTTRIISALSNVGTDYSVKASTYSKAKQYYLKALPLAKLMKDAYMIGILTVNIGEIYFREKNYNEALKYFYQSIKAYDAEEDIPYSLNFIGKVHEERQEYDLAIAKHQQAYDISYRLDLKFDRAISLIGLASNYQKKNNLKLARTYFNQAKDIALELHANTELKQIYEGLVKNYELSNDFVNAFKYQQLLLSLKDSIYNIDIDKKLQGLQFNFDIEKKESEISLLTKDKEIQEQVITRQKFIRNSFIVGFILTLLFGGSAVIQRNKIKREKQRSEDLLLNILPYQTAEELKLTGKATTKSYDSATVLFTDFKNFTQASEILSADELVSEINYFYSEFDRIVEKHGLEKIKTIGDSYMCAGGLPVENSTHAEDAIRAGIEMQEFIEITKKERIEQEKPYFELRIGIHTGNVISGVVGIKKFAYDIWGDTVNTASRMESGGEVGKVNISGSTFELVKDKFKCIHRGKVLAKNKGEIDMYFVN